jgi:hypothetical protein
LDDLIFTLQNLTSHEGSHLDSEGTLLLKRVSALKEVRVNILPMFSCASQTACRNQ